MNCQACEKNPATVHLTEILEGAKTARDLCEECAAKMGLTTGNPIPSLLAQLFEGVGKEMAPSGVRCPECGISFEEFRSKGRFGCPRDYEVFSKDLVPLLEKIHGGALKHVGRLPEGAGLHAEVEDALRRLRRDLDKAKKDERYEDAARIRDEIRAAEESLRGTG